MITDNRQSAWRDWLKRFASDRWSEVVSALREGIAPPSRSSSNAYTKAPLPSCLKGRAGNEALGIIDRFVIGAAAESAGDVVVDSPGGEFASQLEIILGGLEQHIESAVKAEALPQSAKKLGGRKESLQSELWQILHKVRESAELSYAREIDLVELDRRLLFHLRVVGPTVPAGLSASVGVDKAQVSRSVKRLLELKMVERSQIRSPIALTRKGEATADRLLRLADLRNRELTFDIGDRELADFFSVMEKLLDRAIMLYEVEREKADAHGSPVEPEPATGFATRKCEEKLVIDRSRIVSPLLTLSAYFSRSGALTFKRLTGLSNFEAWVLNEISIDPPTDWATLAKALQRDHSQAGRTVNALIEKGMVEREGRPGRRHGRFSPTREGQRLFEIIQQSSLERSSFLMEPLSLDERAAFLATFDKVRRNSAAQLDRERAFEEFEKR